MNILTAYDAFWFLIEHPKFRCREARLLDDEQKDVNVSKGDRIRTVKDEMPWAKDKTYCIYEYGGIWREAFPVNLDIHYAMVNDRGRVDIDKSKNKNIECWLEFGTVRYAVSDGHFHLLHYHDPRLDCGAPTFDEALVRLARIVKKHYGDFKRRKED